MADKRKALVVLSGGQDSTTCAFWAKHELGMEVVALTFDYGQLHKVEIEAAKKIAELVGVIDHEVLEVGPILNGTSPLINPDEKLEQYDDHTVLPGGLEKTFVPARNALFLTLAANRAYCEGITDIITGVCEEDSGGYPDCRLSFIKAMEIALCQAHDRHFNILTPLMNLTKAKTIDLAMRLSGCYEALAYSHTSYDGNYPPTGHDHATLLRAKGFIEAGYPDPLVVRAWGEYKMDLPDTANYEIVRTGVGESFRMAFTIKDLAIMVGAK